MSSPVVGYATLQVIPSLRGVHDAIRRELGAAGDGVGRQAGEQMGRSMGSALSSAVSASAQAAYRALEGASLAAGATAAAALVKGYQRVTTIEDAQAALTISLGDTTAAAALLGDTLEVVQGTPFRLDQFATAAQRMAGMGIEAQKIPIYLTAIGEASATQGKAANEFADRLSRVFGQVSAQGQLQLIDVWRISDTGVNALAILANSFGVTRDEMKDMISNGAVPAGQALDALARGILEGTDGPAGATTALAGTMEGLRLTLSGAAAGADAALARFGAALIAPFSPAATAGLNAFSESLDVLGARVTDALSGVADSAAMERFVALMESAPARAGELLDFLGEVAPLAGGAAGALAGIGTTGLASMLGPLGLVVPQLNPLVAGVVGLALASPAARDALGDLAGELVPLAQDLGEALMPILERVAEALDEVMPAAVEAGGAALVSLGEVAVTAVEAVGPLVEGLLALGTPVLVGGLGLVGDVMSRSADAIFIAASAWAALRTAAFVGTAWSVLSAAFDRIAIKAYDAAGGVGALSLSTSTLATGGLAAIVAVGAGIFTVWQGEARKARDSIDDLYDSLDVDPGTLDLYEIADTLQVLAGRSRDLNEELQGYDGIVGGFKALGELINPFEENDFARVATELGATGEEAERLELRLTTLSEAARMAGMDWDEFTTWAEELNLNPDTQSAIDMAIAIDEAKRRAAEGNPVVTELADSFEILGDETSDAKEELQAFKDIFDALIGTQVNWELAQLDFHDSIAEFATAARDAAMAGEEWSTNLFASDEASRETRRSVAELADEALGLATSYYEAGGGIDGATMKLAEARNQIIEAGVAAGISQADMEAYLDVLGLTPENIVTAIGVDTDADALAAAQAAIDEVARDRHATLYVEPILMNNAGPGGTVSVPYGGGLRQRWGGITEYARGGIHAHVGAGDLIRYAEPATGGEAFIPRLGDRDRSMKVLGTAAGWLDAAVIDKKRLTGGTRTMSGSSSTAPVVHFHAIPMDTAAELEAEGGYRLRRMGLVAR